jgi:hypothetical protein
VKEIILELREGNDYVLRYKVNGEEKKVGIFKLKDLTLEPKTWERVDLLPNTCSYERRTEILERMNAQICKYCGQEDGYFEVHHVRKLSDIERRQGEVAETDDRQT